MFVYLEGDPGVGRDDIVVELHLLRHVSHLHKRDVSVMFYAVRMVCSMHELARCDVGAVIQEFMRMRYSPSLVIIRCLVAIYFSVVMR